MLYAAGVGIGFMTVGGFVIKHWYGPRVVPTTNLQIAIGISFILQVWEMYHLVVLLSLRKIWFAVGAFLTQNLICLLLYPIAIHRFGAVGAVYTLCIMISLVDAWLLPYLVRTQLHTIPADCTQCAVGLVVAN